MAPAATVHSERPIDREERQGLVSFFFFSFLFLSCCGVLTALCPVLLLSSASSAGVVKRDRDWLELGLFFFFFSCGWMVSDNIDRLASSVLFAISSKFATVMMSCL